MTFDRVLHLFRYNRENSNHLGKNFELLMQALLRTDPQYKVVWMWTEFPYLKIPDFGIDIVALTQTGEYWAIQCKCHNKNAFNYISFENEREIDIEKVRKFINDIKRPFDDENGSTGFTGGLFIATLNKGLVEAEATIKEEKAPIRIITHNDLKKLKVDWNKLLYDIGIDKLDTNIFIEQWCINLVDTIKEYIEHKGVLFGDPNPQDVFTLFIDKLKTIISPLIEEEEAIEMLAQHIIAKPILESVFVDHSFYSHNPVYQTMQDLLVKLENKGIITYYPDLSSLCEKVRCSFENRMNPKDMLQITRELFSKYYEVLFPQIRNIFSTYLTSIEVVDFILHSVNYILWKDFNRKTLSDEGVNIIDPFAGCGTFITRLLQINLITMEKLKNKYLHEIQANELILFAYYIATINIENVYNNLPKVISKDMSYVPFTGIHLKDTFEPYKTESNKHQKPAKQVEVIPFTDNIENSQYQKQSKITIIVGNPPDTRFYPLDYPELNIKIQMMYGKEGSKNSYLFQVYIRAFRYCSDVLSDRDGIIALETKNAWLKAGYAHNFRIRLAKEFSKIYIIDLRGDAFEKNPELKKNEGKGIYDRGQFRPRDGGGYNGISVAFFIKIEKRDGFADIYYYNIGDDLNREEKLAKISKLKSIKDMESEFVKITPDERGYWVKPGHEKPKKVKPQKAKYYQQPGLFDL